MPPGFGDISYFVCVCVCVCVCVLDCVQDLPWLLNLPSIPPSFSKVISSGSFFAKSFQKMWSLGMCQYIGSVSVYLPPPPHTPFDTTVCVWRIVPEQVVDSFASPRLPSVPFFGRAELRALFILFCLMRMPPCINTSIPLSQASHV